ncbi:MAG: N-6 DNA methylase [bacterium]|nr:N-6 DNA methylase [bacterium]
MRALCESSTKRIGDAVSSFATYSDEIEKIIPAVPSVLSSSKICLREHVPAILNGSTTLALRELIPLKIRKDAGLFFTGTGLSDKVASRLAPLLSKGGTFIDPACGAGNLLIACAKYLPLGVDVEETLFIWSNKIFGYDLHHEFVRAAQIRLTILAASLHCNIKNIKAPLKPEKVFSEIRVCDALGSTSVIAEADSVVVNPPFGHTHAPIGCQWASGKIQAAGLFFEKILISAKEGQRIVGILPDVLRSGSRYRKWREMIAGNTRSMDVDIAGAFDEKTDVDVFILDVIKSRAKNNTNIWPGNDCQEINNNVVSNFFKVNVGPVVPHRDPNKGALYPYLHARNASGWQILSKIDETRKYSGRVFTPPFVVIHRTSSPRDKARCVGAIVTGERNVAVENHLIVFQPLDKRLASCKKLVKALKSIETNDWLNERIRCRHLTVSALANLPYPLKNQQNTVGE